MKLPVLYERCPCAIGTYRVETRAWLGGISDKDKLKIVRNWLRMIPKLRKRVRKEIKECEVCGEPSSGGVCGACGVWCCLKEL